MAQKPTRFSKRELGFAAAMGVVAAGGIALIVYDDDFQGDRRIVQYQPGEDAEVAYQLIGFDSVASFGAQDVVITLGETFAVRAEGPANVLGEFEPAVEDGRLVIRPRDDDIDFGRSRHDDVTFHITMPLVERIMLTGSGDVTVDRVEGAMFNASVEGGGQLEIGELVVEQADLDVTGSGDLVLGGTAATVRLTINGSGEVDGGDLAAQLATVTINGSGEAELSVAERADVTINGSGDVDISGPAVCSVAINGSGDVSCEGSAD